MTHYSDIAELDDILSGPVKSSVPTRWERKASERPIPREKSGDRFIPNRDAMNTDLMGVDRDDQKENKKFNSMVAKTILKNSGSKILSYRNKAPKPSESHHNKLRVLYASNRETVRVRRQFRHINSAPERILDAPDLVDDYYINVLSWSSQNTLAVGLGPCIYLWDAATGSINLLCETPDEDDIVTSVEFMKDGHYLAVGTTSKDVQIWDVNKQKQLRSMPGHAARIGSLAWNNHILSSGSRDSTIFNHDVRVANHHVHTYRGHEQEICGLTWSPDGTQLASGGNDNMCNIWDMTSSSPVHTFEHKAAVKALSWCPTQRSVLATGAGTADRHIRFFNTNVGKMMSSVDTDSQVCSLQWNPNGKELVSAHGFSKNQLSVWNYPSMTKIADLTGHTSRVLHTAQSPDGTVVCSAAADETLRFWKVFEPQTKKRSSQHHSSSKRTIMRTIR
uniref:CDC20/Fizzy WD40 domain-containing protein n=1 Tax=Lotharella globosa TaxID=91324 RepID=A0A7S3YT40_9EUKA|mmetsp:Transcript_21988/g.44132  ORF Transcript_21988/g.44132 Transcript_21988/m.44132 type:complete len:448 (+) Transcript_21988:54-1397(+)